jgi:perosamine synthetase
VKVPLAKPELGEQEIALISETIRSGWITQGPRVVEFEREFAAHVGAHHAVAVSSCTTALHLGLRVLGVGPGDEVITTPHSFIASANAIRYCGARPVFVDIDPRTLNTAPERIPAAITPRTKAILIVHQVGRPADLEAVSNIARAHRIPLIEDAACAIGSEYRGRKIGHNHYSSLVCFSFHPRKIVTTGDGGMITTDNEVFAQRLRRLRQHGMSSSDLQRHQSARIVTEEYLELGYNYRLTDLQAAMGLAQLRRLGPIVARRRELAANYHRALAGISQLELFLEPADALWNHQTYLVRLKNATAASRDAVTQHLLYAGIATRRGIMSIHREPCYLAEYGPQHFPESERASDQCICLPLFSQMIEAEQNYVVEQLRRVLA